MSKSKHFHCDNCGTLTQTKFITAKVPRLGKKTEISVNAEVCPKCGEKYIPGDFAEKLEASHKKPIAA